MRLLRWGPVLMWCKMRYGEMQAKEGSARLRGDMCASSSCVAPGTELHEACKGTSCVWAACLRGMSSYPAFSNVNDMERDVHLPASVER